MSLIQWNDELSVGIQSIDEQHKKLLDMINALNDALEAGKSEEILEKIFADLTDYTVKHFGYEEELFAKYGYAEEQAHKNEHAELIQQVQELQQKRAAGDFMISVEVLVFLKSFLLNHIMKTDKAYAPFLIEKGAI